MWDLDQASFICLNKGFAFEHSVRHYIRLADLRPNKVIINLHNATDLY